MRCHLGNEEMTMEFKDLTPEQKSKVRGASSAEELLELAKAEGVELSATSWIKSRAAVIGAIWSAAPRAPWSTTI